MKAQEHKKSKFYLKIFSLTFSVFIWLYVVSSAQVEVEKIIPFILEVPDKLATRTELIKEVRYKVKGPRVFVRNFLNNDIKIIIKKENYFKKGKYRYEIPLDSSLVKLPFGVELINAYPNFYTLKLGRKVRKKVPIKLALDAKIYNEFNVTNIILSKSHVNIFGARSVVKGIKEVHTTLIESAKVLRSEPFEVSLLLPDERLKMDKDKVVVDYVLKSKKVKFTFTGVPIIFQSIRLIKEFSPSTVNITVEGDKKLIEKLKKESINVFAAVPRNATGKSEIELSYELPNTLKVLKVEPRKVLIDLEK